MQGAGNSLPLAEYDPQANSWASHVKEPSGWFTYSHTADIDVKRRKMVAIGGDEVVVWDLTQPATAPIRLVTTGATTIQKTANPGVSYDPVSDRIVAWSGLADIYTLDLETSEWKVHAPAATNTVVPTAAAANGTYGRFRYVPSRNVFVVVNAIDQNVFFYKLAPGSGVVPDAGTGGSGGTGAGGAAGTGGSAGAATTGGAAGTGGTQATPDSGVAGKAPSDAGSTAGSDGGGVTAASADSDSGCGCRTSARFGLSHFAFGLLLSLALLARRKVRSKTP
jgi:hypothetical protein